MSKSKGNVISALDILDKYGDDAVRFYFLKEGPLERDEVFSANLLVDSFNSHIINEFSNSLRRISNPRYLPSPSIPFILPAAKSKGEVDFITFFNSKAGNSLSKDSNNISNNNENKFRNHNKNDAND